MSFQKVAIFKVGELFILLLETYLVSKEKVKSWGYRKFSITLTSHRSEVKKDYRNKCEISLFYIGKESA